MKNGSLNILSSYRHAKTGCIKWGALLCGCMFLACCYPLKETYFAPMASSGEVVPNECHEQYGPYGTIKFQLDKLSLRARVEPESDILTLTVRAEPGIAFSFGHGEFFVEFNKVMVRKKPRRVVQYEYHADRLSTKRILQFESGLEMLGGKTYFIEFEGLPVKEEFFAFHIPPLVAGGTDHEFPKVTFSRVTKWRIDSLIVNC